MARGMFEEFGEVDEYIRNLYYYTGANVYRNNVCTGWADAIQPAWKYSNGTVNTWPKYALNLRKMNNLIESVEVPPGMKLEMWDEDNENAEPYTIIGRMREDRKGIYCHVVGDVMKNKASRIKYSAHTE